MNTNLCDREYADSYLLGKMTPRQEEAFEQHLDQCEECRERLEVIAANENEWNDVQELLADPPPTRVLTAEETSAELPLTVQQVLQSFAPTDDPDSLGRIDNFEVSGVVGSGAMGVVLKARDKSLDRIVAIKVMNPSLAASGTARSRFEREAKAAAAILHPNVISIHSVCTNAPLPYLVMPYLKGVSLQERVMRQGPLSVREVVRLGGQIAAGLEAAHQQGVVHRDIKPANIMLDEGVEAAVITDFGLARIVDEATMTRTGVISGTPEYMSPEQARGDEFDGKSDLFSLGSVLHMLCTGEPPFRAKTTFGLLRRIAEGEPEAIRKRNPEIPKWLCEIVEGLQAKSPDARPTATETREQLEKCLAHLYQPDRIPLPDIHRSKEWGRAKMFRLASIGAIAMLLTTLLSIAVLAFLPDDRGADGKMPATLAGGDSKSSQVYKRLELDFPDKQKPGAVIVDINRGFVEVMTHDEPGVVIEVLYPPKARMPKLGESTTRQFAPQFDLDLKTASNAIKLDTYNQDYVLNLRVWVPKKTDLSLDTYYDGYLTVQGVEGTIKTESQHCDITLKGISGSAEAYSRNGNLDISFVELSDDAELDFESYNGSINLVLPEDAQLTSAISVGRGVYDSEFTLGRAKQKLIAQSRLRELEATEYNFAAINGGGIPLRIECDNGEVKLRKAIEE